MQTELIRDTFVYFTPTMWQKEENGLSSFIIYLAKWQGEKIEHLSCIIIQSFELTLLLYVSFCAALQPKEELTEIDK